MTTRLDVMLGRSAETEDLPTRVTRWSDIPAKARGVYDNADDGEGYVLTTGGRHLQRVRKALAEFPVTLPAPKPGKEPAIAPDDWRRTIASASVEERKHLLAAAARGEIKVKG